MMKICVVGVGYVGMAYTILLARNHVVHVVDIDTEKLNLLKQGKIKMKEEGLQKALLDIPEGNIIVSVNPQLAYKDAEYVLVAVPTDYNGAKGCLDTACLKKVIGEIISINHEALIVIKSTLPIGCTGQLIREFNTERIIYSPEFLREGYALTDLIYPTRLVIGIDSNTKLVKRMTAEFVKILANNFQKSVSVLYMNTNEAEAVKLFSNTYLAMRVAFFNELDNLAISLNMCTAKIVKGLSLDNRIGDIYNNPSFGYGGYCLPKDSKQLASQFADIPGPLISSLSESNIRRKEFIVSCIVQKIRKMTNQDTEKVKVGVYRLIMKEYSENFRESAVIDIIKSLKEKEIDVMIYEPMLNSSHIFGCMNESDFVAFLNKVDIIIANRLSKELESFNGEIISADISKIL